MFQKFIAIVILWIIFQAFKLKNKTLSVNERKTLQNINKKKDGSKNKEKIKHKNNNLFISKNKKHKSNDYISEKEYIKEHLAQKEKVIMESELSKAASSYSDTNLNEDTDYHNLKLNYNLDEGEKSEERLDKFENMDIREIFIFKELLDKPLSIRKNRH
ncbi:hypothetical protein VLK81_07820 [Citroniella saccharovorans]|uniref:Uncharacterized protein n=1 Tax=Citroniella saccharovorans TaxID=2053367 RepID=A0AAW9MYE5_9FIRM|nr:hypothetical protein [Citroniella saccharovorans]MEB3429913.1 hypothetical protein [Citroniella saccharovorans]